MQERQIADILFNSYSKKGAIDRLPGEIDLNYRIVDEKGHHYILKVAAPARSYEVLDLENAMMLHLAKQDLRFAVPQPIPLHDGSLIGSYTGQEGQRHYFRLLSWLDGDMLANIQPHSDSLLFDLGHSCGSLSVALQTFSHPAASRELIWDITKLQWIESVFAYFDETEMATVTHWYEKVCADLLPDLSELPHSVCYHDANDYNVLVDIDTLRIAGLIDFGDSLYTPVAMECAIPCTYVMMDKPDPLAAAVTVLRGFQSVHQMSEREIELMPLMIAGRLLLSLCLARQRQLEEPDNEYLQISAAGGWRLLHQLRNRSMTYIRSMFRFAAGLEPCRNSIAVRTYLRKASFTSVIRASRSGTPLQSLDLSVGSKLLGNNSSFDTTNAFNNRIRQVLDPDKIAVGKYLEPRPFYSADSYKIEGNDGREWRTIHMGLDLFAPVGTSILAPHRGQVQAVTYNTGFRDYGHTVILRHETDEGVPFFTLYGHLGSSCLQLLKPGQLIDADEIVGMVGDLHENGEWPPHLHFQVIVHMLDEQYNFPGVVAPRWVDVWQSLCPDPNLILKLPSATTHVEKNSSTRLMTARRELLSSNLSLSYDVPLHIVRGYGSYLYENNGRKYLDLVNNVAHVGHEHPKIVQAAQDQMAVLNTNTRYLHENLLLFAEEVEQCMPAGLETIFVCNSGSEANELALRIAKTVTGRDQFIAIEHGYHGHTNACIEVSSYKFDGPGGLGRPDHVHLVPRPDSYRGIYREGIDSLGTKYAAHVDDCLDTMAQKEKGVAAFIGETILSCGGQIIPPKGYLQEVYQRVREAGGLCIADEVQTGCGRVGSHFWAFETQGVIPDIVTIGKPIGNGHPLGVVVTTRAVEETFANGMEYFNTFGGNPVSCAVGSTVLQVIREEGLQQKAMDSGAYLKERLVDLQQSSSIMGDVRGAGLFIGIEFVRDRKTKTPFASAAHYLVNRLRDQGILLSTDGPDHNVIKIKPPLGVDRDDLDYFLERFEHTMRDTYLRSNH